MKFSRKQANLTHKTPEKNFKITRSHYHDFPIASFTYFRVQHKIDKVLQELVMSNKM